LNFFGGGWQVIETGEILQYGAAARGENVPMQVSFTLSPFRDYQADSACECTAGNPV
jgi:hypothetical protein